MFFFPVWGMRLFLRKLLHNTMGFSINQVIRGKPALHVDGSSEL